jgi:hypothetical protein
VVARAAAALHLLRPRGHTAALADEVEHDVAMHREPMFDRRTSDEIRALTIDAMTAPLAELDLDHAAIWMRGPRADIDAAFGAVHRTATYFELAKEEPQETVTASIDRSIDNAPEKRPPRQKRPVSFTVHLGYAFAAIGETHAGGGPAFAGEIGYNFGRHLTAGLHLGLTQYGGTSGTGVNEAPFSDSSVDIAAVVGAELDRLWGKGLVGARVDGFEEHGLSTTHSGVDVGLAVGFDVFDLGPFRCGPTLGGAAMVGDINAASLNLGVVLRN